MIAATATQSYFDIARLMGPGEVHTFHHASWEDYEELIGQLHDETWLRISYGEGVLQIMSTSAKHENYASFVNGMIRLLSLRLRINIRFFGSATIKQSRKKKGNEADGCFYVQTAPQLGNRIDLDFEKDPPPDVAIEVDIYHDSLSKFSIYAGLGVPEIWRYDKDKLTIHLLADDHYVESPTSKALPMLDAETLTSFLARMRDEGEFEAMIEFENWLNSQTN